MKKLGTFIALLVLMMKAQGALASTIHEVKLIGTTPEWNETLKTLSGLMPGDDLDSNRIQRGTDRIREYYETKGYPKVKVSTQLVQKSDQATVIYQVEPGEPVRIAKIDFVRKGAPLSSEVRNALVKAIEVRPGEPLDRERIKDLRRSIESFLTSIHYVDSKVIQENVIEGSAGVEIQFEIQLGELVVFSVQGNEYFSRQDLMGLIGEQVQLGLGRDYLSSIEGQLKERYVEYGFKDVRITPYTFEASGNSPRRVVYEIQEGPRYRIRRVIFDGNEAFSDSKLESLYFEGAHERIQAKIYNLKMTEDAAASMIEAVRREGYLSAKLIAMKSEEQEVTLDRRERAVDLKLFVSEGVQTRIQAIEFSQNSAITTQRLLEASALKEGEPLNLVKLEDALDRIKREYRNQGYLDVRIANEESGNLISYAEKNQFAFLSFQIDEGLQLKLAQVRFYGNSNTRDEVIERELQVKPGDILSEDKIIETEGRLRRLGVFNQMKLDLTADTGSDSTRNMKISVVEAVPGNAGIGVGFRNDLGLRVFGEVSYSNLWGLNHGWALNMSANRRMGAFLSGQNSRVTDFRFVEAEASISYLWPWVFWGETTFRPSIVASRRQYLSFDAETFALNLGFDRMLYRPLKISAGFVYSLERVRQFNSLRSDDNQQLRIGSITPSLRIDLRDNPLSPRKGFYGFTSFEVAESFLGSQADPLIAYGRYQLRTDYYIDVIPRLIWYTSLRGGWLKNFGRRGEGGVPLIKQFALGGVNSLRGFLDQELNLQNENVDGVMTYVNYRTQMDFLFSSNLTLGPFLDAGNLLLDDFSFGRLRYGTGFGMRYLTPIGPVNFDFGFKLFPRPGEGTNVFYFSLGVI